MFFAWAFSRELDPDREWTAFVAVLLVAPWALTRPEMAQGPLFWLLLATRTVNRTTGLASTWLDAALLLWAGWQTASLPVAVLTAAAFALDARLPGGMRRAWGFALVALVATVHGGAVFATQSLWQAVLLLPLLLVVRATRRVESASDAGGFGMIAQRVRFGQGLVAVTLLAGLACWGEWWVFAPVWAAVWGTSLGRLLSAALGGKVRPSLREA